MIKRTRIEVSETLTSLFEKLPEAFNTKFGQQLGDAVIDEMKKSIAKGVSPIAKDGRFPAYKGQEMKNQANAIRKDARSRERDFGKKDSIVKNAKSTARRINKEAQKKYPYSVQKEYPDKKPRPVNLKLSGDFLKSLDSEVVGQGTNFDLKIGFFDNLSVKKEQGHREQQNGQGYRPIIPIRGESFSEKIMRLIVKMFKTQQKKHLSK